MKNIDEINRATTMENVGYNKNNRTPQDHIRSDGQEGLRITIFSESSILNDLVLPIPPEGRMRLPCIKSAIVEIIQDKWIIHCGGRAHLLDVDDKEVEELPLRDESMLRIVEKGKKYRLYVEQISKLCRLFHNYMALANTEIHIGRSGDNDIICSSNAVSRYHATLQYSGKTWYLRDCKSTHGVYVNNYRVEEAQLAPGDRIVIPGMRIIIGCGFLSIDDANEKVIIRSIKIRQINESSQVYSPSSRRNAKYGDDLFYRYPRSRIAFEAKKIEIETPPVSLGNGQLPLLMRMGNSIVMGSRAALTGNVAMLAGSIFLPILAQQYTKEEREEYERKRNERYRIYLDDKWREIQNEKRREEYILNTDYPVLSEVLKYTSERKKLWERRKSDDDFLVLRVGHGQLPIAAEIESTKRHFELEIDPLLEEMYDLAEKKILLEDVPILLNLRQDTVLGILGNNNELLDFAKSMIMRLALLYSYDEVKIMILADSSDMNQMEFVRYLPHVWDDQRMIRFLACEPSEAYQLGEYINKSLEDDMGGSKELSEIMRYRPYYIVFAFSKNLFEQMEVLKTVMQCEKNCGISVIALFEDLPKECSILIQLAPKTAVNAYPNTIKYLKNLDKQDDCFALDKYSTATAREAMRELADIKLKILSQAYSLPKSYSFLEMYGVGRIEDLNIIKRWQENDPTKSLNVPIGIGSNGTLFMLDLHQKYHGPHGLVAGTTGSGKSEFLITYILSLAINYHPDEVSFLLIDYKGGGLAGAFDDVRNDIHLPHLVGTITNLDGSAIARSLICIQSEIRRRQIVFNRVKSETGEGTMDIYTYQKLYRRRAVEEPMPHLFIISDEFAELKQQQPEFLDALVSIARVGRSLGVHLILATQKPAGIVTDQIVSNSKFRVCLKVQERADSMDMLKRPEACELRETGRFYLQVGANELFALGQAAWCGAEYEPEDIVQSKRDDSIHFIDNTGASILQVEPETKRSKSGQSQLVAIVKELSNLAKERQINSGNLWLPPLKDRIDIDSLIEVDAEVNDCADIVYPCGLLDDPDSLSQRTLNLNLTKDGNVMIVGEPRTGKTTFVQSMLYALSEKYTPEQFIFYSLDYSGRLIKLFKELPHCGAVLTEEDDDLLDSFFDLINSIIRERKTLFSQMEVDNYETACQIKPLPLVLVVIDNLSGMANSKKGQKHLDILQTYMKNGGGYGIRFVISISHLNDATLRVKQELTCRVALQMRDRYEYGEALNQRISYLPPKIKGRGLYVYQGKPLELQAAMFAAQFSEKERIEKLKGRIKDISSRCAAYPAAPRMRVIPETQSYEDFCQAFLLKRFPLGYAIDDGSAVALPLKQFSMMTLYFGNTDSVVPVLENIIYAGKREAGTVVFLSHPNDSCFGELKGEGIHVFEANPMGVEMMANSLLAKIGERFKSYKAYCQNIGIEPGKVEEIKPDYGISSEDFKPIFVIFEKYTDVTYAAKDSPNLAQNYELIFTIAKRYQIYLIACVYPEDYSLLNGAPIYDRFNPEKLSMLFGGNLNKQRIVSIPYGKEAKDKASAYNRCLMHYRDGLYPLLMPCGVPNKQLIDEDDRPIFKQA